MSKWLSRINQRTYKASGDKVDVVDSNSTLSTVSPRTECVNEKKYIDDAIKKETLRNLIVQLRNVYGGDQNEWFEYANDVINNWSHDLDLAIDFFKHLHNKNRSAIALAHEEILV